MSFNPIGPMLSALNRLAGSEHLHRLGLYRPAQKIAYHASREGFRAATAVGRQLASVTRLASMR